MSPTGEANRLCSITAFAGARDAQRSLTCRGLRASCSLRTRPLPRLGGANAALGLSAERSFSAASFRDVFVQDEGNQHHGLLTRLDVARLQALLATRQLTLEQFKAALFTNTLTPERVQQLQAGLAEARRLEAERVARMQAARALREAPMQ